MPLRTRTLLSIVASLLSTSLTTAGQETVDFVNPFIGTANAGNTFPGAVRPWGMVSVSPHNDLAAPSGYTHGKPWFFGIGMVHLSGTGCADLGSIIITATEKESAIMPEQYKCTFADEMASPGYWETTLVEPSLRLEATATTRAGIIRFSSIKKNSQPKKERYRILIDAGRSLGLEGGGMVRWVSPNELEGYNLGGGFCGETNRHTVYFFARFSSNGHVRGVWCGAKETHEVFAAGDGVNVGAWVGFETDGPVEVRVGISYVSVGNARRNLEAEGGFRPFDELRAEARDAWEAELSRARVSGGTAEQRTIFTTALYHALIHPGVISDANGEYPLFGRNGVGVNVTRPHYSVFSLWDTYRTLHPLLTLLYPGRQSAMVSTMIDMYKESGWLPKWELAANETHMMVGDGAVAVLADTYMKGIRDYDTSAAYAAMYRPGVETGPQAEPSRPGYAEYLRLGYIPVDQDTSRSWWVWGPASTTLEYCASDWAFAQTAREMGHISESKEFIRRSLFYRNLFDSTSGLIRPRSSDGRWLEPFDPLQTEGSGNWSGSGGPGYVEGNAWQYSWFVPHDVPGLVGVFGGRRKFVDRLDEFFRRGLYTIGNEPDFAYPYLFTYMPGEEGRTVELVREIMRREFGSGADGLPGNDDAGALSAWYVFSALGLYPACPGNPEYRLGEPAFPEIRVQLDTTYYPASDLIIRRHDRPITDAPPAPAASWNGTLLREYAITHRLVTSGGLLEFSCPSRNQVR
jgi:predicted alpha-1,2-mannosidase